MFSAPNISTGGSLNQLSILIKTQDQANIVWLLLHHKVGVSRVVYWYKCQVYYFISLPIMIIVEEELPSPSLSLPSSLSTPPGEQIYCSSLNLPHRNRIPCCRLPLPCIIIFPRLLIFGLFPPPHPATKTAVVAYWQIPTLIPSIPLLYNDGLILPHWIPWKPLCLIWEHKLPPHSLLNTSLPAYLVWQNRLWTQLRWG